MAKAGKNTLAPNPDAKRLEGNAAICVLLAADMSRALRDEKDVAVDGGKQSSRSCGSGKSSISVVPCSDGKLREQKQGSLGEHELEVHRPMLDDPACPFSPQPGMPQPKSS